MFLAEARDFNRPCVLHVKTKKGKGYEFAEEDSSTFHSPSPFVREGCRVELKKEGRSFTAAIGEALVDLMKRDELAEERLGHRPTADSGEHGPDETPPEARLAAGSAPALFAALAREVHVAPRGVDGGVYLFGLGPHAVAREGSPVDLLDRRVGPQQRVARVEEDGPDGPQGITWPPSITRAWPVTFRASSDAR